MRAQNAVLTSLGSMKRNHWRAGGTACSILPLAGKINVTKHFASAEAERHYFASNVR
jgi:hypothetical protein